LGRTNIASTFPITGVFFSLIKYPFVLRELIVDKLKVLGSKVIKSGSHWWWQARLLLVAWKICNDRH
jgi:hypothetical protein